MSRKGSSAVLLPVLYKYRIVFALKAAGFFFFWAERTASFENSTGEK